MAWVSPRTWVAGTTVLAAWMNEIRDSLKAIGDPQTSYTPTYSGITIGNATVTAKYLQAGKLVIGSVKVVWGSTSAGTGNFEISLPVTAAVTGVAIGAVYLNDTSAPAHRTGTAIVQTGATRAVFLADGGAGIVATSTPFAWATGDVLTFNFTYEAA